MWMCLTYLTLNVLSPPKVYHHVLSTGVGQKLRGQGEGAAHVLVVS